MPYTIKKVEVWAGDILNRPGMLARVFEALTNAGAQLEFMIARRLNEKTSRVFLAPIQGVKRHLAAMAGGSPIRPDLVPRILRYFYKQKVFFADSTPAGATNIEQVHV